MPSSATSRTAPRCGRWSRSATTACIDCTTTRGARYRRCANFGSAIVCSWLVEASEAIHPAQCRSCRLNRTLPDLSQPDNQALWARVERDKQRLVASLIALGLPVASRAVEDPERGLAFDLLRGTGAVAPVMTGHLDGVITLNIEEADDARREAIRATDARALPHLLGHVRHESGHYYWTRLVDGTASGWSRFAPCSATSARTTPRRCSATTTAARLPTGRSRSSARMPVRIRGKTGPKPGPTTCTCSTRSTRR